jgi:SAM-dependent methyltransferase
MSEYDAIARFYELEYSQFTEDLAFYHNFAQRCGSPVLELGCGTGRVLIPLARAGFRVTGIDNSPAMLALARDKLAAPGLSAKAKVFQADMRSFHLEDRFRLAICPINTFMHMLTISDQTMALECARAHLGDKGLLVLDLFNPDVALLFEGAGRLVFERELTDPVSGTKISKMVSSWVDPAQQLNYVTYFYDEVSANGELRRTVVPIKQRYFYRFEMQHLLERGGFRVEQVYGSYDLDEYTADGAKMIFVARKEGPNI